MTMRISINAQEREIALLSLDRADKQCDATRKGLERLRLEPMALMALQGRLTELRRQLKDTKRHVYDWTLDLRIAMATALHVYREQLGTLASGEGRLLVETSATDQKISDVKDFIARTAGQDTLFTEVEHRVAVADAADRRPAPMETIPPALQALVDVADRMPPAGASEVQVQRALERLSSELDRSVPQLAEGPFRVLAQAALRMAARVVPEFDGTYAGAYLMEEVVYDDANALVLGSWIRAQLDVAKDQQLPLDEPPKKLTPEGINEIRKAVGKDPLEEERQILAENIPRNPLEFGCRHCGAFAGNACTSVGGKIIGSTAHAERMKDAGMWGDARSVEIGNRLYTDAVLFKTFGRVDDEVRTAVQKRRTIDLDAKWARTLLEFQGVNGSAAAGVSG